MYTVIRTPAKTKIISDPGTLCRVGLGYHKSIHWYFMTISHTMLRPNKWFGHIRNFVGRHGEALSMDELCAAILNSSTANQCALYSVHDVYGYKSKLANMFTALEGLKNYFAFKFHISYRMVQENRIFFVEVYRTVGSKAEWL